VTTTETIRTCVQNAERQVQMLRKYAQCGPRLRAHGPVASAYFTGILLIKCSNINKCSNITRYLILILSYINKGSYNSINT